MTPTPSFLRLFAVTFFIFYFAANSHSQSYLKFVGSNATDFGTSVIRTKDGGYALTMETSLNPPVNDSTGGILVKTDCLGEVEWSRTYAFEQVNVANDVKEYPDSSLITEVFTYAMGGQSPLIVLVKTDAQGNLLWSRELPLSAISNNDLVIDDQGNIYVCANAKLIQGGYDIVALVKLDRNGNVIWSKQYSSVYSCLPVGMTLLPGGRCAIASMITMPPNYFLDVAVTLTDTSGNQLKTVITGTYYDDEAQGIESDASGNLHVYGRSYFMDRNWDATHLLFDSNLNLLQNTFYDAGTGSEIFRHALSGTANDIFFFGDAGSFDSRNLFISKCTVNDTVLWSNQYTIAPLYTNYIFDACMNGQNGFMVTGDVEEGGRLRDALLMQIDSMGHAGCETLPLPLSINHDAVTYVDTLLVETQLPITISDVVPVIKNKIVTTLTRCSLQTMCIDFMMLQDSICPPCIQLRDQSRGNTSVRWDVQRGNEIHSSTDAEPVICVDQEGDYVVTLTIWNPVDTMIETKTIHIEKDCPLFIPNIFTPNDDQVNDEFKIRELPGHYRLQVFNRWGNEVYESSEPGHFWNGKNKNGTLVTSGVYYYLLSLPEEQKEFKGWVEVRY